MEMEQSACPPSRAREEFKTADQIYINTVANLRQVDISTFTEVEIRAPAKVVWEYLTDMRMAERYTPARYHLRSGYWGETGNVVDAHLVIGGRECPFPRVRHKITDSIRYKYFVFRMSLQVSEDAIEEFAGYDVYVLHESAGVTNLSFVQAGTFGNLNLSREEVQAFKEGQRRFIPPIFEELKRLVESEHKP